MEETVEQVVDSAADVVAGRSGAFNLGHLAVVSAVALGAGAGIAWLATNRHYKAKYERLLEEGRLEAKAFYSNLYKKDEFATPGEAVEALGVGGAEAVSALKTYGATRMQDVAVAVTETVEVEVEPVEDEGPISKNIFADGESYEVWDQDEQEAFRETLDPGAPYIICHKEFLENEEGYDQKTLTYFAEDDVLVDDKDQPIPLVDEVVGEEHLTRFGFGVLDDRIVLVRNDRLNIDFEIIKDDGSYSKKVLGFQHSYDGYEMRGEKRPIRKFRGVDE